MASANLSSIKTLQKELKELKENPVEGFIVDLLSDDNLFEWQVAIFGPPKTLYEGGYFKAVLNFPCDYPYSPPSMKFITKMFHPNIFENGDVCISILHTPGDDPQSGELPSERWNPTQNVRTILLSVISMLNEPNINSAAHVDASVSFRKWQESNGHEKNYECMVRHLVFLTKADAEKDKVKVPMTLEEYCGSGGGNNRNSDLTDTCDYNDYLTPDYDDDDEDEDDDYEDDVDDIIEELDLLYEGGGSVSVVDNNVQCADND